MMVAVRLSARFQGQWGPAVPETWPGLWTHSTQLPLPRRVLTPQMPTTRPLSKLLPPAASHPPQVSGVLSSPREAFPAVTPPYPQMQCLSLLSAPREPLGPITL